MFFSKPRTHHFEPEKLQLTLQLSDRALPLTIVTSARAKRLTLRIEAGGKGVRATIPPRTSEEEVMHCNISGID